jgi:hypothetical protein
MAKKTAARKRTAASVSPISIHMSTQEHRDRVFRVTALYEKRTGFPISLSAWLNAVVMRAVEEEERQGKG